ncbi:WD repeat-containing protein 36, partial [Cichlidogyrus casuarinus]
MYTGSNEGSLNTWILKVGNCHPLGAAKELHWNKVMSISSLPPTNQDNGLSADCILTQGADNSLKVCLFDRPGGEARIEYQRSGHFLPPSKIAFWPGGSAGGQLVFSAGLDRQLRIFSIADDHYSRSFGQTCHPKAPKNKKSSMSLTNRVRSLLPPVVGLSLCDAKADAWDSMALIHEKHRQVGTWDFVRFKKGKHWLDPRKFQADGGKAFRINKNTTVCISPCGNFILVGYSNGDIVKFNAQSGEERGTYSASDGISAHRLPLVGVFANSLCSIVVSVASESSGIEAEVAFWDFIKGTLYGSLNLNSSVTLAKYHSDTDLLAVALTQGSVLIIDSHNRRIIRRLSGSQTHPIVDLKFSPDSKWLIVAHKPSIIRTWDLIDCKLIDSFSIKNAPITGLELSPCGEFLATIHSNIVGIVLWDNQSSYKHIDLNPLPVSVLDRMHSEQVISTDLDAEFDRVTSSISIGANLATLNLRVRRQVDLDMDDEEILEPLAKMPRTSEEDSSESLIIHNEQVYCSQSQHEKEVDMVAKPANY